MVGDCPGKQDVAAFLRSYGQAVKTPPFHGGNPGSIPGRITKKESQKCDSFFIIIYIAIRGSFYELSLRKTAEFGILEMFVGAQAISDRLPYGRVKETLFGH